MNEEIVFGMGMDTGAFFKGLRQTKSGLAELKSAAAGVGDVLKGMFVGAAIEFFTSKLLDAGEASIQFGAHLSNIAEEAGVSTRFLQQFSEAANQTGSDSEAAETALLKLAKNIGEARAGSIEAAAAFKKWNVELNNVNGTSKTAEQVTDAVSKRMGEIEDPTLKAAMATELYGKSAAKLVLALNDLQKFKGQDFRGLGDFELSILKKAEEVGKQREKARSDLWGKITSGGLIFADAGRDFLSKFSGGYSEKLPFLKPQHYLSAGINAQLDAADKRINPDAPAAPIDVKTTKEWVAAWQDLQRTQRETLERAADAQIRLAMQMTDEKLLKDKIAAMDGDSVEKVKLQNQLALLQYEILLGRNVVAANYTATLQKQVTLAEQLVNAKERATADANTYANKQSGADEAKYTIEELANSQYKFDGRLGQDQENAKSIIADRALADHFMDIGQPEYAKKYYGFANDIAHNLSSRVVDSDRNPYQQFKIASEESKAVLDNLLKAATKDGVKIIPANGK